MDLFLRSPYLPSSCMLSPTNPYVYYIAFLGPSCLILLVNLAVFIMVARVLFTPRLATTTHLRKNSSTGQQNVTLAQVRGAFTVMVLLGVTWVFGALAVGELKLFFQYVFCICNSLQGFLIFLVRCVCYPEARIAWSQLLRTGTIKKYRGMVPPGTGSWYANSSSNQNKAASGPKTRSKRTNSSDSTTTVVFNSNYWNSNQRMSQTVSQAIKNANLGSDAGWPRTCHTFAPLGSSVQSIASGTSRTGRSNRDLVMNLDNRSNLDRLSTMNYIDDDDQETRTESSSDVESYTRRLTLPLVPGHDVSSQSSACTRSSQTGGDSPVCRFCNRSGCNGREHNQCLVAELSFIPI